MAWHILSKPNCPYCVQAKTKLMIADEPFTVKEYTTEAEIEAFKAAGHRTFPRVYRDGELIGGYEDLVEVLNQLEDF